MALSKEFDDLLVAPRAGWGAAGRRHTMRSCSLRCLGPHGLHRMAYVEWGDPDNPRVLVCVHGLTRNGRDFDVLANALAAEYRVVCPDVVGRGSSDRLPVADDYALTTYANDVGADDAIFGRQRVGKHVEITAIARQTMDTDENTRIVRIT
ncbi:MAG: alpha/beta fold hydrolase, partial [Elusimicrobia bacterium]